MPHRAVLLASLIILLPPTARAAWACSCEGPSAPRAIQRASAIFIGRVTRIELIDPPPPYNDTTFPAPDVRVAVKVLRWWKGAGTPEEVVYTESAGCGYSFFVGEHYLVYGYRERLADPLWTWECGRTQPLNDAGEDLALLGRGWRPEEQESAAASSTSAEHARSGLLGLAGAGGVGLLLGFALAGVLSHARQRGRGRDAK